MVNTMSLRGLLWVILGGAAALAGAEPAHAQSRPGPRVIRLADITIEGRIQKPQAFYILQRSSLNFEGLELKKSFLPKIVESAERAPF